MKGTDSHLFSNFQDEILLCVVELTNLVLLQCLYMDYVGHFPSQLQEVCDLLVEKEIRLRLPLEELDILTPDEGTKEDSNNEDTNYSSSPILDPYALPLTNMT